ncbi:MAG: alanine--glyoxylate aminotransferase family protein, partial [Georgfuchsia sp.]
DEGLENAWARHALHHQALKAGFDALGLSFLVREDARLPQLNAVRIPDGVDEAAVRKQLLDRYDLEIGAGLGPLAGKVWRFGLMGYSARAENVKLCLGAMADVLSAQGIKMDKDAALAAAQAIYTGNQA